MLITKYCTNNILNYMLISKPMGLWNNLYHYLFDQYDLYRYKGLVSSDYNISSHGHHGMMILFKLHCPGRELIEHGGKKIKKN